MNYLVNDLLKVWIRTGDSYNIFGLSDSAGWYCCSYDAEENGELTEFEETQFSDYRLASLLEFFPRADWVSRKEWSQFVANEWPKLKERQRLGQAFMNHFYERLRGSELTDKLNLYNITDKVEAYRVIFNNFVY